MNIIVLDCQRVILSSGEGAKWKLCNFEYSEIPDIPISKANLCLAPFVRAYSARTCLACKSLLLTLQQVTPCADLFWFSLTWVPSALATTDQLCSSNRRRRTCGYILHDRLFITRFLAILGVFVKQRWGCIVRLVMPCLSSKRRQSDSHKKKKWNSYFWFLLKSVVTLRLWQK